MCVAHVSVHVQHDQLRLHSLGSIQEHAQGKWIHLLVVQVRNDQHCFVAAVIRTQVRFAEVFTLLAESVPESQRVTVQGVSDTLMGAAGALGGATSGLVLASAGYQGLNTAGGVLAAAVLAFAVTAATRRKSPASA